MRNPLTLEIYAKVMTWLEKEKTPLLRIPVMDSMIPMNSYNLDEPVKSRLLLFRRVVGTFFTEYRQGAEYTMKDGTRKTIWYDPDWEGYYNIEKILEEE